MVDRGATERSGWFGKVRQLLVGGLEWLLVAGFGALTLDVLWGVFSRYVMGEQSPWTEELAIYLLVWVSLLGAALTYAEKGHLGVDYFVGKMDPAARKLAAIVVELLVLGFALFALCYGGWVLVTETLAAGQISPGLGIKMGYVYFAVPLCGAFFVLFSAEQLWRLSSESTASDSDNT